MVKMNRFGNVALFVALNAVAVVRAASSFETSIGLWVGNNPVPIDEGEVFISKKNESIRLWCKTTTPKTRWTECSWTWKELSDEDPPTYCKIVVKEGDEDYNNCNKTLKYVEDRCEVTIPATEIEKHEGDWRCTLGKMDKFFFSFLFFFTKSIGLF
jgi:hypothetical protein